MVSSPRDPDLPVLPDEDHTYLRPTTLLLPTVAELYQQGLAIVEQIQAETVRLAFMKSEIVHANLTERHLRSTFALDADGKNETQRNAFVEVQLMNDMNAVRLRADRSSREHESDLLIASIEAGKLKLRLINSVLGTLKGDTHE